MANPAVTSVHVAMPIANHVDADDMPTTAFYSDPSITCKFKTCQKLHLSYDIGD